MYRTVIAVRFIDAGGGDAVTVGNPVTHGAASKLAARQSATDIAVCANGNAVFSDTTFGGMGGGLIKIGA